MKHFIFYYVFISRNKNNKSVSGNGKGCFSWGTVPHSSSPCYFPS